MPNTPKRHPDADYPEYYGNKGTLLVNLHYIENRIKENCLSLREIDKLERDLIALETEIKWR